MTIRVAQPCGCAQEHFMGQKREKLCECGNLFEKPGAAKARAEHGRRPQKRTTEPKRDWTDARAKVEEEGCCRICKRSDRKLEAAHILGREHDEPKVRQASAGGVILKELYVHPNRVVPLCGPFPEGCHGDVEYHRVNLVHVLTLDEQLQAVKDAGGIGEAWRALAPVDYRAEVEAVRA